MKQESTTMTTLGLIQNHFPLRSTLDNSHFWPSSTLVSKTHFRDKVHWPEVDILGIKKHRIKYKEKNLISEFKRADALYGSKY